MADAFRDHLNVSKTVDAPSWIEGNSLRKVVAALQCRDIAPYVRANLTISGDANCAPFEVDDTLATQKLDLAVNVNCGESKSLANLELR
jgi:hypothetical protein